MPIYKPVTIGQPKTGPLCCDLLNHNAPARKDNNSIYKEISVVKKRQSRVLLSKSENLVVFWQCPLAEQGGELCSRGVWRSWEGINTNLIAPVWAKPPHGQKGFFLLKQIKLYCKLLADRTVNVDGIAGSRIEVHEECWEGSFTEKAESLLRMLRL